MTDDHQNEVAEQKPFAARTVIATVAVIVVAVLVYDFWNRRTQPIFAVRPHPMLPAAMQEFIRPGYGEFSAVVPRDKILLDWTSFFLRHFGGDYVALMRAQLALLAAFLGVFAFALRPNDEGRGAFAAVAMAAFTPLVVELALAFDDHLFNALNMFVALAALAWSNSGRRVGWMLIAGVAAGAALRGAFIVSNGLLALATVFFAAVGMAVEHGIRERRTIRHAIATRHKDSINDLVTKPAVGAVAMVAGFAVVAATIWFSGKISAEYYAGEASSAFLLDELRPFTPSAAWAYPWLVFHEQLGPVGVAWLAVGLAALVAFRPKGLGMWAGASLVPFAALCAIAKKNPYYDIYAVLPMIGLAACGVASIPRPRVRCTVIAIFVVGNVLFTGQHLFVGRVIEGTPLVMYHFQEQPAFFLNTPRTEKYAEDDAAVRIASAIRGIRPTGDVLVLVVDETVFIERVERLRYFLATRDRHLTLLVTQTARALPWEDRNAFVLHLREDGAETPPVAELLSRGANYHREPRTAFADGGGLVYLDGLSARAGSMTALAEDRDWILFGFRP